MILREKGVRRTSRTGYSLNFAQTAFYEVVRVHHGT